MPKPSFCRSFSAPVAHDNDDVQVVPGVVENLKVITRTASQRIAEYAFKYAQVSANLNDKRHQLSSMRR